MDLFPVRHTVCKYPAGNATKVQKVSFHFKLNSKMLLSRFSIFIHFGKIFKSDQLKDTN